MVERYGVKVVLNRFFEIYPGVENVHIYISQW